MVRTTNRYDRINPAVVSFDEDDDNDNDNDYDNDDGLIYSTFDEYVADFDASSSSEDNVTVITKELDGQEELLDVDDTSTEIDVITEELGQELLNALTNLSDDDDNNNNNNNNNNISIQVLDIVHEYDESDFELMKEGLLLLIDDDDDNEETIDEDEDILVGFLGTATTAITTATTTTTATGLYPSLVPQVTFDEDDNVTTPSTPSPWLNGQLTSYYATSASSRGITYTSNKNDKANEATRHQHWTQQEDEQLKIEVEKIQQGSSAGNNIDWRIISNSLPSRSAIQCKCRWNKYLQPTKYYGKWDKYEDECILTMKREGFMWADIASRLERRTGDYIRDRYVNFLDPNIKKTNWTEEEDQILFKYQRILGNKWSEIQKILPGPGIRPQNSIKNRYNNRVKAQNRRLKVKLAFKSN
jgi:hypothetical protein